MTCVTQRTDLSSGCRSDPAPAARREPPPDSPARHVVRANLGSRVCWETSRHRDHRGESIETPNLSGRMRTTPLVWVSSVCSVSTRSQIRAHCQRIQTFWHGLRTLLSGGEMRIGSLFDSDRLRQSCHEVWNPRSACLGCPGGSAARDPRRPRRHCGNENTDGLVRQYLARDSSAAGYLAASDIGGVELTPDGSLRPLRPDRDGSPGRRSRRRRSRAGTPCRGRART